MTASSSGECAPVRTGALVRQVHTLRKLHLLLTGKLTLLARSWSARVTARPISTSDMSILVTWPGTTASASPTVIAPLAQPQSSSVMPGRRCGRNHRARFSARRVTFCLKVMMESSSWMYGSRTMDLPQSSSILWVVIFSPSCSEIRRVLKSVVR